MFQIIRTTARVAASMAVLLAASSTPIFAQAAPADSTGVQRIQLEADDLYPRRICQVRLVEGQPDGEARFFALSGSLCMVEHYSAGLLDGERMMYYPNGNPFGRLVYDRGVPVGEQVAWYPDGTVLSVTTWRDGYMDGPFLQYYPGGVLKVAATMVRGVFQGERRHYLPDGRLFGITQWVNGHQVDQLILLEPTRHDLTVLEESGHWVGLQLKDVWRSE